MAATKNLIEQNLSAEKATSIYNTVSKLLIFCSYSSVPYTISRRALEEATFAEVRTWVEDDKVDSGLDQLLEAARVGTAMAEYSYHLHDFKVKLLISLYTTVCTHIDDIAEKVPLALEEFQYSLYAGKPQKYLLLKKLAHYLTRMYEFWDPVCISVIVCSTLEFFTGCLLETKEDVMNMTDMKSAPEWPFFLRAKTGVGAAYAFMVFPKGENPVVGSYIQAIPDIAKYIGYVNDVLSFYKEELAGETMGCIQSTARDFCDHTNARML